MESFLEYLVKVRCIHHASRVGWNLPVSEVKQVTSHVLLLIALTVLFSSCARQAKPMVLTDAAKGAAIESNSGTYYVVFAPNPNPVPLNGTFSAHVDVYQNGNRAQRAPGVVLSVDALMPEHNHGMNTEPTIKSNSNGSFDVSGLLFHMPGKWELYFDIKDGRYLERAQVPILLK
jgi:hypothetical protein